MTTTDDDFKMHGAGNTPEFSLDGLETAARVVSLYDGDTVKVVFRLFCGYRKFSVRLAGIDACEIRAKDPRNRDLAARARDRLIELVSGEKPGPGWKKKDVDKLLDDRVALVWLRCRSFDKWGRVLADVFPCEKAPKSFSDVLLEEKLAYRYEGGTKLSEEEERFRIV